MKKLLIILAIIAHSSFINAGKDKNQNPINNLPSPLSNSYGKDYDTRGKEYVYVNCARCNKADYPIPTMKNNSFSITCDRCSRYFTVIVSTAEHKVKVR